MEHMEDREGVTGMYAATCRTADGTVHLIALGRHEQEVREESAGAGPDLQVQPVVVGYTTRLNAPYINLR